MMSFFFFSSRRRHTRCSLVTGVQTCALPILFTPARTERALYVPPIANYTFLRSAAAWERVGARFFPTFSGVVMIESGKQLYAGSAKPAKQRRFARPVEIGRAHV